MNWIIPIVLFLAAGLWFFIGDLRRVRKSAAWSFMKHPLVIGYIALIDVCFWWVFTIHAGAVHSLNALIMATNGRNDE